MSVRIVAPPALQNWPHIIDQAHEVAAGSGARVTVTDDVDRGLAGVDFIYTDVWVSMGEPKEVWLERIPILKPYRVTAQLMAKTGNPATKFMHCLPTFHDMKTTLGGEILREAGIEDGLEVSDEVFESDASIVFDQAENRMHTIKAHWWRRWWGGGHGGGPGGGAPPAGVWGLGPQRAPRPGGESDAHDQGALVATLVGWSSRGRGPVLGPGWPRAVVREVQLDMARGPGGHACAEEVSVLGPNRAAHHECRSENRPVVRVALGDPQPCFVARYAVGGLVHFMDDDAEMIQHGDRGRQSVAAPSTLAGDRGQVPLRFGEGCVWRAQPHLTGPVLDDAARADAQGDAHQDVGIKNDGTREVDHYRRPSPRSLPNSARATTRSSWLSSASS